MRLSGKSTKILFAFAICVWFSGQIFGQKLQTIVADRGNDSNFAVMKQKLSNVHSLTFGVDWLLESTSHLESKGEKYEVANLYDGNQKTTWIEGVKGYGVGERIKVRFRHAEAPGVPITGIMITNGFAKDFETWSKYSRVRQLKLYVNGTPTYILQLHDSMFPQVISWSQNPIMINGGYRFELEILSVYEGEKGSDTAISDFVFVSEILK